MKRCTFSPFPVMNPMLMEKGFLLTILFVIGVYLLRKLLGWRELGEVSWSKHKLEINLSHVSAGSIRRTLFFFFLSLSDFVLQEEVRWIPAFYSVECWLWLLIWYSFLATDTKNTAHWVYLELSFLFWSYTELHFVREKYLDLQKYCQFPLIRRLLVGVLRV